MFRSEYIQLLQVLVWPLLAGAIIFVFWRRIGKVRIGPIEVEIRREMDEAALKASPILGDVSLDERNRADRVAQLAKQTDVAVVRHQIDALAIEYDFLRASMPRGEKRTREMQKVVSKMRVIGRAAHGIRYELAAAPSPGRRLQAVACLQVFSDYEMLDWLAERVCREKPFISYHALVALYAAASGSDARLHLNDVQSAYAVAKKIRPELADGDRLRELDLLENKVAELQRK